MKYFYKIVVVMAIFVFSIQPLFAQSPNPIYFGARLGMNMANASVTPDLPAPISKSGRTGFSAGVYSEFGVAEDFAITTEALYNQGGFKASANGQEATFKFDEISVPISGKYKFAMENSTVKPFLLFGGNVGFVIKSELEGGGQTQDLKSQTESMSYGVHFGAGVEFEVSPGVNLFFDGRYALGLKDVDKSTDEVKPWNIGILAGVAFKLN